MIYDLDGNKNLIKGYEVFDGKKKNIGKRGRFFSYIRKGDGVLKEIRKNMK